MFVFPSHNSKVVILAVKEKLILVVKEMLKEIRKAQVGVSIDPQKSPKPNIYKIYTQVIHTIPTSISTNTQSQNMHNDFP
jgi:hypothetical protein